MAAAEEARASFMLTILIQRDAAAPRGNRLWQLAQRVVGRDGCCRGRDSAGLEKALDQRRLARLDHGQELARAAHRAEGVEAGLQERLQRAQAGGTRRA